MLTLLSISWIPATGNQREPQLTGFTVLHCVNYTQGSRENHLSEQASNKLKSRIPLDI
jgi:hypothetical protein